MGENDMDRPEERDAGTGPTDDGECIEKSPLPLRIKSGSFEKQCFSIETAGEIFEIPWENIELLTLGVVEEDVGNPQGPKSGLRNLIRKVFFGEETSQNALKRAVREVYLIDVFVKELATPFRIESTSVNYRKLLPEAGFVSFLNFLELVKVISRRAVAARVDASCFALMKGRRENVRRYPAIYDFDLESQTARKNLSNQCLRGDLFPDEPNASAECAPADDGGGEAQGD